MNHIYEYHRPAITVDAMVFRKRGENLQILLIKRKNEPFRDMWALPGGFLDMDETLEEAVQRELKEETGMEGITLKQFKAFSAIDRDPRGHTISVVFYGHAGSDQKQKPKGADDAQMACWHHMNQLPKLAFDHQEVLRKALESLNL